MDDELTISPAEITALMDDPAETITGNLESLVLSYKELSEMGFDPAFVEDYLNQLRNILLIAGVEDGAVLRILALEEDVAALTIRVGNLELTIDGLVLSIDALELAVSGLETRVNQLEVDLTALTIRVSDNEDSIDNIENVLIPSRMQWRNNWAQNTYLKNDTVRDGNWTMIANKTTDDRPAPQEFGDPTYILPDVPAWLPSANLSSIQSGQLYTFTQGGWSKSVRVFVPAVSATIRYRFVIIRNPFTNPVSTVFDDFVVTENEWTTLAVGNGIVSAGEQVLFYIDALDSGASTSFQYPWTYGGSGNNLDPIVGAWTKNNPDTRLNINKTDGDGIDHTQELDIVINSTLTITQLDNPNKSVTYSTLTLADDLGAYYQFNVLLEDQGSEGLPDVGAGTQIRVEQPIPSLTGYSEIVDYWLTGQPDFATVEGYLHYDDVDQIGGNNAYGVDIEFQRAEISPDWDLVALSNTAGSAGSDGGSIDQRYYGFNTVSTPVIVATEDPVFTVVNEYVISANLAAGNYELKLTVEYAMPDTNDSFVMRVISPFTQGTGFRHEAKDQNNSVIVTYILPVVWAGGSLTIALEAAITPNGNDATVNFSTIIWDQK